MVRPVAGTGIETLDGILEGGLPIGAISELVGPECSGRTSVALSFLARMTQTAKVCAWIDVSNEFDPLSAAAAAPSPAGQKRNDLSDTTAGWQQS
jgi:RecA/RadA recombinase